MLALPGNAGVQSVNPLIGEINDGYLNDFRSCPITPEDVFAARGAKSGTVEEGSVGADTGAVAFDWKGGIGTASRKLPASLGRYTVGVLVETNSVGCCRLQELQWARNSGATSFVSNWRRPRQAPEGETTRLTARA